MNLVRWNPFQDIPVLRNQMNRLFDNALSGWPGESNGTSNWLPAIDIHETDEELVVLADVPGFDPKKIDVRVENNVLTIHGERQLDQELKEENFHRIERSYGVFARSFTLSRPVDSEKIRASYKDGVLRIAMPKAESAKPKRIQISAAA